MCFSLGNPTPLANEGGIYHPHRCGRCRGDSDPSAWEQFTLFPLIVPEKCDSCGEKALQSKKKKLLGADTSACNNRHSWKSIAYRTLEALKAKETQPNDFLRLQPSAVSLAPLAMAWKLAKRAELKQTARVLRFAVQTNPTPRRASRRRCTNNSPTLH